VSESAQLAGPPSGADSPPSSTSASPVASEDIIKWYNQEIHWGKCEGDNPQSDYHFDCATIKAPLSWQNPNQGEIDLALKRHAANGQPIGALLVNFGGPGAPGVRVLPSFLPNFGAALQNAYDIIGFDPRGVGESTPVVCFDSAAAKDAQIAKSYAFTAAGNAEFVRDQQALAQGCYERTGPLYGLVDTVSAARDLDLIRALLGQKQLNYLGFSYGTKLGATYAGLFPQNVGRMVLDGAIDITKSADELNVDVAIGFENAARAFVAACLAGQTGTDGENCTLSGSVDQGMAQIRQLLERAYQQPLPTEQERPLTQLLAVYGILAALYDNDSWPRLTGALAEAINEGTGTGLLKLSDWYTERNTDGTYASNLLPEAYPAVTCLDEAGTVDPSKAATYNDRIAAGAPTFGDFYKDYELFCQGWPVAPVRTTYDLTAPGANDIMVIGATNDPATPYRWARAVASTLDSGFLVTFTGEGHTGYGRGSSCIDSAVDTFLVKGKRPASGITCAVD
jgi:pimeloyl-ACP methyl ester carboxylesterase